MAFNGLMMSGVTTQFLILGCNLTVLVTFLLPEKDMLLQS